MLDPEHYDANMQDKEDFKMSLVKYMIEGNIEKKDLPKPVETVKMCLDFLHDIDPKWRVVRIRGFNTKIKLHGAIYQTITNLINSQGDLKKLIAIKTRTLIQESAPEKSEHNEPCQTQKE